MELKVHSVIWLLNCGIATYADELLKKDEEYFMKLVIILFCDTGNEGCVGAIQKRVVDCIYLQKKNLHIHRGIGLIPVVAMILVSMLLYRLTPVPERNIR